MFQWWGERPREPATSMDTAREDARPTNFPRPQRYGLHHSLITRAFGGERLKSRHEHSSGGSVRRSDG
jgi:hypothetical protein